MVTIGLQIIANWILMGCILALTMVGCLYFAILCEKITDYLSSD